MGRSCNIRTELLTKAKYAKRIYPLCSQWKDLGETKKYDLQDFKRMLGLIDGKGNEKMKQLIDLRTNVLDVAVRQINEHTELRINYKLEKVGRSYKNIVFTVKPQALATPIPFAWWPPFRTYQVFSKPTTTTPPASWMNCASPM
nr:replication initiation protein [Hymenobacter nivis]